MNEIAVFLALVGVGFALVWTLAAPTAHERLEGISWLVAGAVVAAVSWSRA